MASAVRGMSVAYDKEGVDPGNHRSVYSTAAHCGQRVPVTSFRTGINDDESGLRHDYEVWLEGLARLPSAALGATMVTTSATLSSVLFRSRNRMGVGQ